MNDNTVAPDWIAVDWGTTNLRLWLMCGPDMLEARESGDGMAGLNRDAFAGILARETDGWPILPVVACGMIGSRQGWAEAPYALTPCPAMPQLVRVPGDPGGRPVFIACGIRQTKPAADVMRGEETQIAGLLARQPDFDGVVCLPGTHTKWVHVSAGEIVSFKTSMTGEIFALLSTQSVLRHSVTGAAGRDDAAEFAVAVGAALSNPAQSFGGLFRIRAESLTADLDAATARARLSGTLIGLELAATRPWWLGQSITLIGAEPLCNLYQAALETQGAPSVWLDAATAVRAGLYAAFCQLRAQA